MLGGWWLPDERVVDAWSVLQVLLGRLRDHGGELVRGAVDYARSEGAPAVEGYPADNRGEKVDLTMAYVGTRAMFEAAGFTHAADTDAVSGGFPRVVMRLDLR